MKLHLPMHYDFSCSMQLIMTHLDRSTFLSEAVYILNRHQCMAFNLQFTDRRCLTPTLTPNAWVEAINSMQSDVCTNNHKCMALSPGFSVVG